MAFEIPDHYHRQFTTNVELLLQQKTSKFAPYVAMQSFSGEAAQVVKQFGEVEFQEKTARHEDTTFSDILHKQRWIFPTDYDLALPVEKEDEIRMLNSPLSPYAEAMRAGWARKVDTVIRDALLGDARTGKNGATTTSFDTSNQQIAAAATGLTIAKLRSAREIAGLREADEEPWVLAASPKQRTNLLATTEVTSSDYNTVKALAAGEIDTFMGFKFIWTNRLGVDGSSARRCVAWCKSGLVMGQWNGLETKIGERPDKKYLTQVFMKGTIGATRTQEAKVIEILCVES